MFEIHADGTRLSLGARQKVYAGSALTTPFAVYLSEAWDGLSVVAAFYSGDVSKSVYIEESGKEYQIPWECLTQEQVGNTLEVALIGVGTDDNGEPVVLLSSARLALDKIAPGVLFDASLEPTPSLFQQMMSSVNNARVACTEAQEAAEKAAEEALGVSGYLFFQLDEHGHLIYERTHQVQVDFEIGDDGHLIWGGTET